MTNDTLPAATILPFRRTLCIPIQIGTGLNRVLWRLTLDDEDGRGFVSIVGEDFAAYYYWPRVSRGVGRTLPAFLFGVGLDYFAGKMGADRWFDAAATEKQAAAWLAEHMEDAGPESIDPNDFDDLRSPSFHTQRDWEDWCTAVGRAGVSESFYSGTVETVRPDVRRFYEAAWPLLRARQGEIEAALYGPASLVGAIHAESVTVISGDIGSISMEDL